MRVPLAILATTSFLAFSLGALAAPPTPITTCGSTITTPGNYVLEADLACAGDGIVVDASNVFVRLQGHSLTGSGNTGFGIAVRPGRTRVKIQGDGLITGFLAGIVFENTDKSSVQHVRCDGNSFGIGVNADSAGNRSESNQFKGNVLTNGLHGITVNGGDDNHFVENTANSNQFRGIFLYKGVGNMLEENTANGNGEFGITTEGGNTVTGCFFQGNTAFGNGNLDLLDGNPDCATDLWSDNSFGTAFPDCVQ